LRYAFRQPSGPKSKPGPSYNATDLLAQKQFVGYLNLRWRQNQNSETASVGDQNGGSPGARLCEHRPENFFDPGFDPPGSGRTSVDLVTT
jgi:hypothetical protein